MRIDISESVTRKLAIEMLVFVLVFTEQRSVEPGAVSMGRAFYCH